MAAQRKKDYRISVTFRAPASLLDKLDAVQSEYRKRDRTETIVDLLKTAMVILEKKPVLEDSDTVKYLRENLYNYQIVDWVAELNQDRLEALYAVLADERRIRLNNKFKKS